MRTKNHRARKKRTLSKSEVMYMLLDEPPLNLKSDAIVISTVCVKEQKE